MEIKKIFTISYIKFDEMGISEIQLTNSKDFCKHNDEIYIVPTNNEIFESTQLFEVTIRTIDKNV